MFEVHTINCFQNTGRPNPIHGNMSLHNSIRKQTAFKLQQTPYGCLQMARCIAAARRFQGSEGRNKGKASRGYESIGSFHGDNIEYLTQMLDEEYRSPELPFVSEVSSDKSLEIKDWNDEFMLDKKWSFMNHGAFGAALRRGHVRANEWREFQELQPLRFFDRYLLPHLAHSNRVVADFIGADNPGSTTLIQNVTSGMNSVLSGYARVKKSTNSIVLFDVAYGSVKKMCNYYVGSENVHEVQISSMPTPLSSDVIIDSLERSLEERKKQTGKSLDGSLLVLDHVTSNTAMLMPIETLAEVAKREGMLVLVDGAHGLLNLNLDMRYLSSVGVDFYITNCHKWLSSPRGAAILHCDKSDLRESILRQPAVISHGIDDGFLR